MSTTKKLVLGAVAIVAVIVAILLLSGNAGVMVGQAGWPVHNTPETFSAGIDTGDGYVAITKGGIIGPGANQASWRNTLGRPVLVYPSLVSMGFNTGTASSSLLYYVGTSTSATISNDFAAPAGVLAISGSSIATSTPGPNLIVGVTAAAGIGLVVADGAYLNVQIQSKNGATCNGAACETATSTNRGISNFFWRFTGFYKP